MSRPAPAPHAAAPSLAPPVPPARRPRPFRRRGALHARSLHFGPTMTPMVDVVMVILVFFMASAAFVGPEWFLRALVPLRTPPAGAGTPPTPAQHVRQELVLDLSADGRTIVRGLSLTAASLDEAESALASLVDDPSNDLASHLELVIRPSPRVPYRDVVRLHEAATRLGIARVGLGDFTPPG